MRSLSVSHSSKIPSMVNKSTLQFNQMNFSCQLFMPNLFLIRSRESLKGNYNRETKKNGLDTKGWFMDHEMKAGMGRKGVKVKVERMSNYSTIRGMKRGRESS